MLGIRSSISSTKEASSLPSCAPSVCRPRPVPLWKEPGERVLSLREKSLRKVPPSLRMGLEISGCGPTLPKDDEDRELGSSPFFSAIALRLRSRLMRKRMIIPISARPAIPPITPPATTPALEVESLLLEEPSGLVSLLVEVEVESAPDEILEDPEESAVVVGVEPKSVAEVGLTAADCVPVEVCVDVAVAEDVAELVLGLAVWSLLMLQTPSEQE